MTPACRTLALGLAAAAVAAAIGMPGCARPSDEAAIRAFLETAVSRAERRDVRGLMELFAADYRDFEGRDPAATEKLVEGYLGRYHGLVIHLLGSRVGEVAPEGSATVECEVALSHGAAEVLRKLVRFAGEYYRFTFEVRKTAPGTWRFTSGAWESIDLGELFPESLEVLRKLFPGL
jgi:hypothetical protein